MVKSFLRSGHICQLFKALTHQFQSRRRHFTLMSARTTDSEVIDTKKLFKNPHRWLVVLLVVLTSVGHYVCIQLPSSLEKSFYTESDSGFQYNNRQTATLYSVAFYPAAISSMIGGMLCDKYGIARCRVYFWFISSMGQLIVALACWFKSYELIIIGRIVYGLTSEAYQVACTSIISKYFENAEVFLGMSVIISIGRITTSITYVISPMLMDFLKSILNNNVGESITIIMFSGWICMLLGMIANVTVLLIDNKHYNNKSKSVQNIQKLPIASNETSVDGNGGEISTATTDSAPPPHQVENAVA